MATHFIILVWKIAWTEEPGRLQSMGSHKNQTQLSMRAVEWKIFSTSRLECFGSPLLISQLHFPNVLFLLMTLSTGVSNLSGSLMSHPGNIFSSLPFLHCLEPEWYWRWEGNSLIVNTSS